MKNKLKVANLYAGIGGNRKLWEDVEVTAIELDPSIAKIYQDYFPDDKVIVTDAHQYLLEHYKEFDFIWSSPPCPTHSRMNVNFNRVRYIDIKLYEEIILLETWFKGKYCVENVKPYYEPLRPGIINDRHIFWCNFPIKEDKSNGISEGILEGKNQRIGKQRKKTNQLIKEKAALKGYDINKLINVDKDKVLKNTVKPETGLYILNCARNIITKQNVNQVEFFE